MVGQLPEKGYEHDPSDDSYYDKEVAENNYIVKSLTLLDYK